MTSIENRDNLTTSFLKCVSFVESSIKDAENLHKHGMRFGAINKLEIALQKVEDVIKLNKHVHRRSDFALKNASLSLLLNIKKLGEAYKLHSR